MRKGANIEKSIAIQDVGHTVCDGVSNNISNLIDFVNVNLVKFEVCLVCNEPYSPIQILNSSKSLRKLFNISNNKVTIKMFLK